MIDIGPGLGLAALTVGPVLGLAAQPSVVRHAVFARSASGRLPVVSWDEAIGTAVQVRYEATR